MTEIAPIDRATFLVVDEVVRRAKTEFATVVTDHSRAMKLIAERLLNSGQALDPTATDEYLLTLTDAVEMICLDDRKREGEFLKCIVVPGEPIEIVYHFDSHETESSELLARLSAILGYTALARDDG